MPEATPEPMQEGDLTAAFKILEQDIICELSGTADHRSPAFLDRILKRVHTEAVDRTVDRVNIDLRRLEFLNSTCVKSLVNWIGVVRATDPDKRYRIQFQVDPEVRWQKLFIHPLKAVGGGILVVKEG